jgi:hypothetical protein
VPLASFSEALDTFAMPKVVWDPEPEDHDYPAAQSYLSLLADPDEISRIVDQLRAAPVELVKAKDVIRAAGLPMLDRSNFHVRRDLKRIVEKKTFSPVLLVRGDGAKHFSLTIADGYHRACAAYWNNEDDFIHARIASWSSL